MEALSTVTLELPYPPSVNHYWRRVGARTLVSREGRRFRERVVSILAGRGVRRMTGPLAVRVVAHPPDMRKRDLDNIAKALLDALERGGAFGDDSQVDRLEIERGRVVPGGRVTVQIAEAKA